MSCRLCIIRAFAFVSARACALCSCRGNKHVMEIDGSMVLTLNTPRFMYMCMNMCTRTMMMMCCVFMLYGNCLVSPISSMPTTHYTKKRESSIKTIERIRAPIARLHQQAIISTCMHIHCNRMTTIAQRRLRSMRQIQHRSIMRFDSPPEQ